MTEVSDRDIFDARNFADHLRWKKVDAENHARRNGYKYIAWHDGCIYAVLDGDCVFKPSTHADSVAGWQPGLRYSGLNDWLNGFEHRGFAVIPLTC